MQYKIIQLVEIVAVEYKDHVMIVGLPVRITMAKQLPSTTREPLNMMFLASNAFGSAASNWFSTGSLSPVSMDWSQLYVW